MKILPSTRGPLLRGLACGLAVLAGGLTATAHPYASGLTNNAGTISFILNESADDVKIAFDNLTLTNDLGAMAKGFQSFALGSHTNYAIIVSKIGSGVPAQLSVDTNFLVNFLTPRGVAVNMNPKTHNFGRVYVSNTTPGTAGGRAVGRGLYILNADQSDTLGLSNAPSTGGAIFVANASSPFHPGVGPDDSVYLNDFSTANAATWVFNPDITTNQLVLAGIGENTNPSVHTDSASTPVVRGSLATGDLVLYNIDGASPYGYNSTLRWTIGAGPLPWTNAPDGVFGDGMGIPSVADLTDDLDIGKDGKFILSVNRSAGTDVDSVEVFDTDGVTKLWGSLTTSLAMGLTSDMLKGTMAIQISPDGKYLAMLVTASSVNVVSLTNGIPDLSSLFTIAIGPLIGTGRDMAFDAADNIYTVSSGQTLLRVYSLGLTTTAITSNDASTTNGAFQLITPSATASVAATTPLATEAGSVPGTFTITRFASDISSPLTVNFTLTGTATNGVQYSTSATNSITIPENETNATVTITPIEDHVSDPTLTVILSVKGGPSYSAASPSSATVSIADDGPEVLAISSTTENTMYEAITSDYVTFAVTRLGDTNNNGNSVVFTTAVYGGAAVPGLDYVPTVPLLTFAPGDVTQTFTVSPLHDPAYTGNKTFTVAIGPGLGYTPNAGTATATIIDAENAPETTLWADNLNGASSATNWSVAFAANNGIQDYDLTFGYDLASDGVSNAPNGSATALKMTVNKDEATANGAAGLNLYPIGKSFSGDYALRFSMNLVQNDTTGTTEFALWGINASGNDTNWFIESGDFTQTVPANCDGIWYSTVSDASGSSPADYTLFTGGGPTNGPAILNTAFAGSFTNQFKSPPYSSGGGAGSPGNIFGSTNSVWSDVEIRQIGNLVRYSINKTVIFDTTNTTAYQSGKIMIGYCDPYASIGASGGAVYYSNLRVVALTGPTITSVSVTPTNQLTLTLTFTDNSNDPTTSFALYSAPTVGGTYASTAATITETSLGTYSATTALSKTNVAKFYRVKRIQ